MPEDLVVVIAVVVVGVGLGLAAGTTTEAVDPCVVSPQSFHVKTIAFSPCLSLMPSCTARSMYF